MAGMFGSDAGPASAASNKAFKQNLNKVYKWYTGGFLIFVVALAILEQMGLLTEMDMAAFAGYCQAYARWKEAEEFITQHGAMVRTPNGYLQQVPQVSIAQTNMKIMLRFCEQFGLTPSARSRIIAGEGSVDPADEMERLLGGED